MGRYLKNFLFPDGNWLVEVAAEESAELEQLLHNKKNDQLQETNHEFKLPDVIGILPIRNAVAYPGTIMPLAIGRERSKRLLADTKPNKSVIGLVTQHNPETDRPDFDGIYSAGTTATVLKVIKMPQGPIHIIVHGTARFKIIERLTTEPYLKARVQLLDVKAKTTKKVRRL